MPPIKKRNSNVDPGAQFQREYYTNMQVITNPNQLNVKFVADPNTILSQKRAKVVAEPRRVAHQPIKFVSDGDDTSSSRSDSSRFTFIKFNDKMEEVEENGVPKKSAPRSSDLYRVGPLFSHTIQHLPIYRKKDNFQVTPILEVRIDRGFETSERGWVGYKRNYFALVAAFQLLGHGFKDFIKNNYYLKSKDLVEDEELEPEGTETKEPKEPKSKENENLEISYFAIRLVSKCSDESIQVTLIQHTAKRDKGPQMPPPIYPAVPGHLPNHDTVKSSSNIRNNNKLDNDKRMFYFDRHDYLSEHPNLEGTILSKYPGDSIAKVARFERVQFGSSRKSKPIISENNLYYLRVELLAVIERDDSIQPILISTVESPPLIIRGRTPASYDKKLIDP